MDHLRHTIWLVDDSPAEMENVRASLSPQYDVEVFTSGAAVLERLAEGHHLDVLVLDWIMPGIDGLEVCRFIRSTAGPALPILLLTAHRSTDHIVEGLKAGANDFVSKPFATAELSARVSALVRSKRWREKAERADRERVAHAEERARLNDLFVGIIGHDLRNPLNAIATGAALVARTDYPAEQKLQMGHRIAASTRRMAEMIEQLLDVTRTRLGGGIAIERRPGDLGSVCQHVVDELLLAYPGRAIVCHPCEGDTTGMWDSDRIAQALSNVISNALQHGTPGRPITITTRGNDHAVVFAVHNEGAAITPAVAQSLFDPFRQAGMSPSTRRGGLGLGLYITRQIVQSHGGTIELAGDRDITFLIRLPRVASAPAST